jgi:nitroreductase
MKRLGEILLERGAIAVAELHTGLEACHYSGGRLGTQLLKFGFVDEHALLEALSEQLGIPWVSSSILRRAPDNLKRLIPLPVARRVQVVVFEQKEGNTSVAMTTPRNPAAIEEVVSYLGLDIKPHVATEVGILAALAEVEAEDRAVLAPGTPANGYGGAADEWQHLWTPPKLRSSDLLRIPQRGPDVNAPLASTFPGLSPVPATGRKAAVGPLEDELYRQLLGEVRHRDDVGDLLLRRVASILDRCCLLAVHSGKVVGWLAKGVGVVLDDVQSISFPQDVSSVISLANGPEGYWGPIPMGGINDSIKRILGDPAPTRVAVIPVRVKNRIVAYLVGDAPASVVSETDRQHIVKAVQRAGIAFEVLIMKKKIVT